LNPGATRMDQRAVDVEKQEALRNWVLWIADCGLSMHCCSGVL